MAESTTPRASAGDPSMSLRPVLQALLSNARLVTGARAAALAVPAGPDGRLTLISVDGDALTAGATLDPETMPGLRVLPLPPPAPDVPAARVRLLVLRGLISNEPGSALASCLLALAAVVHAMQVSEAARRRDAAPAAPVSQVGFDIPRAPEIVLERTLQRICRLLEADLASVAIRDRRDDLVWRGMVGYRSPITRHSPVGPGAGLAQRVTTTGQLHYLPEADPAIPLMIQEGVESALGVPVCIDEQPIGALIIGWRRPRAVSGEEQRLVLTLADQVAGAVVQTQLYEETYRQRHFLQSLINHTPAGIVAFTLPDFRVREVNRFYLQFLDEPFRSGTRPLQGLRLAEFLPQAGESGIQAIFDRVAATGEPFTIREFEYQGFSRGTTYWNWSLVPLQDTPDEALTGLLLLVVESTEQVLARRRLAAALGRARDQAGELEAVIQQMVEGVAICDAAGNLTKINPAGVAMLGRGVIAREPGVDYAERYQLYDTGGNLFPMADLPTERARRGETVLGQDMLVRAPDGRERIISVSAAPLMDESNNITGAVAVFHDVTKAREVERLKDDFLAIVSHELRTPLAAILGYTDIMLRGLGGPLTPKQEQNQQSIKSNATRLLALINDLLDVSKLEAHGITLNADAVPLQHLIPKAVAWVQVLASARGVNVEHRVPANLPPVWGDADRLHQVLTNLLSNAIKFTPAGGTVVVQARNSILPADAPPDSPDSAFAPPVGESILVSVQDTGVGLPGEELARIWDRFYQADSTTSRRYGGTGLGLTIVKNLVELHGGQVWATSAGAGKGSTFHFRLPLAPDTAPTDPPEDMAAAASSGAEPADANGAPAAAPLILVIEDNADLASIMRTMLDAAGYRVALAQDGPTGIDQARRLQPAAIMLDVILPRANGWEVLQQLKHDPRTAPIPVIVVSILEHHRLGLMLGATEYLVKPFDRDRLVNTLRNLTGRGLASPRVLVVDDAPSLRDLLKTRLSDAGYTVATAEDGLAALDRIAEAPPDLLILDLMMPRLDGFAVLEWVRAHTNPQIRELPVVLVSAKDLTAEERAQLADATQALIPKVGMSLGELLRVVKETLEKLNVPTADHDHPGTPC
jgi:signal transduction histidine kinase/CheY-like chemotaxis protein